MSRGNEIDPPVGADAATSGRVPLRRFAMQTAGPREFMIAGTINGGIAWWLFGGPEPTPLVGPHSVMTMWIPLSFFLPGLSSFFGVLAGALGRKGGGLEPPLDRATPWVAFAVRVGLLRALVCCGLAILLAAVLERRGFEAEWSGWTVVIGISFFSGLFAFLMHTTAILASLRLGPGPRSHPT